MRGATSPCLQFRMEVEVGRAASACGAVRLDVHKYLGSLLDMDRIHRPLRVGAAEQLTPYLSRIWGLLVSRHAIVNGSSEL